VGGIVALVVLLAGLAWVLARPRSYAATATLVVLPTAQTDSSVEASYFDTLSQGQIAATYAAVLRSRSTPTQKQATDGVTADVTLVPDTSAIDVHVTAPRAPVAERVAARTVRGASNTLDRLAPPYRVSVVDAGAGSAKPTGASSGSLLVVVVLVSLVAGVGTQQLLRRLAPASDGVTARSTAHDGWTWFDPVDAPATPDRVPVANGSSSRFVSALRARRASPPRER
jgi:hypothetical protein